MNSSASLPALHGVTGLSVFPVVNSLCAFNLLEYSEASKVTINTSKFFSVTELHKPIWTAAGVLALSNSVPQGIARYVWCCISEQAAVANKYNSDSSGKGSFPSLGNPEIRLAFPELV